jgi:tubulin-specific chaperone A
VLPLRNRVESEVSARAYGIFMKQASTESGGFAGCMGISQKSVEDMINTPLDFMLKFSEGMKGCQRLKPQNIG